VEGAIVHVVEHLIAAPRPHLAAALAYALGTRGKRVRPILCVTAFRGVSQTEPRDAVYRLASSLELVHTYSLVHDDLPCMDDDDLRRGRATVHRAFDAATATLVGAALLPLAVQLLDRSASEMGLDGETTGRLIVELCRAAGAEGMVGGQFLDLEGESRVVDGAALEAIHRAKTGALLAASLRIGGLAGGADARQLGALTEYGEALGLAFQIADDVLDVTADTAELGKTAGKDEHAGKATYPALFGLEGARALARDKADQAVSALDRGGIHSAPLAALARYVVERKK